MLGSFTLLQAVSFLLFPFNQRVSNVHFPKILFGEDSLLMGKKKRTGMDLVHQSTNVEIPAKFQLRSGESLCNNILIYFIKFLISGQLMVSGYY